MGKSKAVKVISYIILLLVLVGGIGVIFVSNDVITYDKSDFYIVYNDTHVGGTLDRLSVNGRTDVYLDYYVKTLAFADLSKYTVSVKAETIGDFVYYVDGERMHWCDLYIQDFFVEHTDGGIPERKLFRDPRGWWRGTCDFSIPETLRKAHGDSEIVIGYDTYQADADYFKLTFSVSGCEREVSLCFRPEVVVTGVSLSSGVIVF